MHHTAPPHRSSSLGWWTVLMWQNIVTILKHCYGNLRKCLHVCASASATGRCCKPWLPVCLLRFKPIFISLQPVSLHISINLAAARCAVCFNQGLPSADCLHRLYEDEFLPLHWNSGGSAAVLLPSSSPPACRWLDLALALALACPVVPCGPVVSFG